MKKLSLLSYLLLLAMSTLMITSCGDDDTDPDPDPEPEPELNILEWAAAQGDYTLLLAAAEKAGLNATLADPASQFTIFGPKDPTFQGFLDAAAGGSLDNVSPALAGAILTNHALLGLRKSTDLVAGYGYNLGRTAFDTTGAITTSVYLDLTNGVAINGGTAATGGATVTEADLEASNGIIHVVDNVIVPPNLSTFLAVDPELSMTLAAMTTRPGLTVDFWSAVSTGLDPAAPVPYNVFAPTNAAWEKYLADNYLTDMSDIDDAMMTTLLGYHVAPGALLRSDVIADGDQAGNLNGTLLTIGVANGTVTVTAGNSTATVTLADIQCQNGVMHKVDTVID